MTLLFQVGGDPNPDWESLEGKIEFDYSYMPLFGDIEEIYGTRITDSPMTILTATERKSFLYS